jgi:hypothetical protein
VSGLRFSAAEKQLENRALAPAILKFAVMLQMADELSRDLIAKS